ncbi:MAG: hypothetical protein Q8O89_05450 [Nanoarchaeota archaeon]|nr:hypothetical protein [Nanoarchaeota archaeon]
MGNITLAIPEDVHKDMKSFSEVRWSEVARKAIVAKLETLKMAEKLAKKSKITQSDADAFSKKIKTSANKRFLA